MKLKRAWKESGPVERQNLVSMAVSGLMLVLMMGYDVARKAVTGEPVDAVWGVLAVLGLMAFMFHGILFHAERSARRLNRLEERLGLPRLSAGEGLRQPAPEGACSRPELHDFPGARKACRWCRRTASDLVSGGF